MWEVDPETRSKLHQIQKKEGSGNDKCCDCGAPSPQWASPKFSTFICLTCAGTHRGLGVHISFVRSISMDAFKQNEILRMQNGGNKAWQEFYNNHSSTAGSFEEATIKERYESEVGEEWKESLSAKIEGRVFDREAWVKERAAVLQKQASRTGTPVSSSAGKKSVGGGGTPGARSESPSARGGKPSSIPNTQKARNETYFAQLGSANASRSDDLPPSQGGKYAGFGSGGGSAASTSSRQGGGGIPSADEFQEDPVAALTKGFGWFSAAVGRQVKVVNEGYIQPTAKNIAASDFAAQARVVAAQAGQGIQTGAKTAAESINRFVEGQDERAGAVSGGGGAATRGPQRRAEPERKDFWDSFGEPATPVAMVDKEKPSSIGTAAMKKGGGGGEAGSRAGSGAGGGGGGGQRPGSSGKGKDDAWGDDW